MQKAPGSARAKWKTHTGKLFADPYRLCLSGQKDSLNHSQIPGGGFGGTDIRVLRAKLNRN
jgi:hypothetical protein